MSKITALFGVLFIFSLSACVTHRKHEELQAKKNEFERQNQSIKSTNEALETQNNELTAQYDKQINELKTLKSDTSLLGSSLRHMRSQYDKINELNETLMSKNSTLLNQSAAENQRLLNELNQKQLDNIKKEDQLRELENQIAEREANLNSLTTALQDREAKVAELESMIAQKDAAVEQLRSTIANALLGFKDKGLTVEEKNGKVYVSLEAKLLFPSGSTAVNSEGKQALVDLAKAIEDEKELEIIVEGHTDTDAMNSASIPRDNWELSVLRATAVVKIMVANSNIDPKLLSAAGRSEYLPVDPSNKAKNRRIEIIISPNLNELLELIGE